VSTEHPRPALPAEALPSEQELDAAGEEVRRLERDRAALLRAEGSLRTEEQTLLENLCALEEGSGSTEGWDLEALEERRTRAERERRVLEGQAACAPELRRLAHDLEEQRADLARAFERKEQTLLEASRRWDRSDAVTRERRERLPEGLSEPGALQEARVLVERRLRALQLAVAEARKDAGIAQEAAARAEAVLVSAEESATQHRERLEGVARELQQRLREAGFSGENAFLEAKLSGEELEARGALVREHRIQLQAARSRWERTRAAVDGVAAPDLEALEAGHQRCKEKVEAALQRIAALQVKEQELEGCARRLEKQCEESEGLEAQLQITGHLAEVAGGRNPKGITLQRFVLASVFDDVLAAATERMRRMSQGRFRLLRALQRCDQRVAGGLDLEVYDEHTGTNRPAATLSGGESFLAALSLALGLADVVQTRVGGLRMDMLFVDEGFGSLDSDTLDRAMDTLLTLQEGGRRLVGIISHIAELKERVDTRLEVSAERSGSTARFVID